MEAGLPGIGSAAACSCRRGRNNNACSTAAHELRRTTNTTEGSNNTPFTCLWTVLLLLTCYHGTQELSHDPCNTKHTTQPSQSNCTSAVTSRHGHIEIHPDSHHSLTWYGIFAMRGSLQSLRLLRQPGTS